MILIKKGLFALDSTELTFEGYDTGTYWNGWNRPYFTKEVAEKILSDNQKDADGEIQYDWSYDKQNDRFIVQWVNTSTAIHEEKEVANAEKIADEFGNTFIVYPIGEGWCWEGLCFTTTFYLFISLF